MPNNSFNSDSHPDERFMSRSFIFGPLKFPGTALWLIRKGVVKNEAQAHALMLGIIIFNVTAVILLYSTLSIFRFLISDFSSEVISVYQGVQNFGLPYEILYVSTALYALTVTAMGDVAGLLCALWLPIFLMIIFFVAFRRSRRTQEVKKNPRGKAWV